MLLLIHNIHISLNLNILYNLEQKYDSSDLINKLSLDYLNYEGIIQNMKEFDSLYINNDKDIKFSF
jgi:hypothetical protein